jgi:predicted membrane GTPase involved in stress response
LRPELITRSENGCDVSPLETLSLEKERFAGDVGERIGKAVSSAGAERSSAFL